MFVVTSTAVLALGVLVITVASPLAGRAVPYFSPADGGGSMLDSSTAAAGLGEPLNVIVSGLSSSAVLTDAGFLNWAKSVGFSTECLGFHSGTPQTANLGDGNGPQNEIKVIRQDYGDPDLGTCIESVLGGDHFRYWRQNGPSANSGALFLAVSHEESLKENHTIEPDGYDKGRDELVANATRTTSFGGVTYSTTAESITGLLQPGSTGINHGIAIDGIVILLTVTIQ